MYLENSKRLIVWDGGSNSLANASSLTNGHYKLSYDRHLDRMRFNVIYRDLFCSIVTNRCGWAFKFICLPSQYKRACIIMQVANFLTVLFRSRIYETF